MEGTHRTFTIGPCLGRGGFGEVYRARMTSATGMSAVVALKVLRRDLAPGGQAVQRLRDEGVLLAKLNHPTILRVHDLVVLEGRVSLVTEYVDGVDLEACLRGGDRIGLRALAEILGRVASALDAAHNAATGPSGAPLRLVHRDVKPSNIRIGRHGEVKLLDFGIARSDEVSREARTQTDVMVGSPPYMAPERFLDSEPRSASDVFSLGAIALEAVIRARVFDAPVPVLASYAIDPRRYADFVEARFAQAPSDTPPAFLALCRAMLAFEPESRPAAAEVARAAEGLIDDLEGLTLSRWCRTRRWTDAEHEAGDLGGRILSEDTLAKPISAPTTLPVPAPDPDASPSAPPAPPTLPPTLPPTGPDPAASAPAAPAEPSDPTNPTAVPPVPKTTPTTLLPTPAPPRKPRRWWLWLGSATATATATAVVATVALALVAGVVAWRVLPLSQPGAGPQRTTTGPGLPAGPGGEAPDGEAPGGIGRTRSGPDGGDRDGGDEGGEVPDGGDRDGTDPNRNDPDGFGQTGPDRTGSDPSSADPRGSDPGSSDLNEHDPSGTEPNGAGPNESADPSRTDPSGRPGPNEPDPNGPARPSGPTRTDPDRSDLSPPAPFPPTPSPPTPSPARSSIRVTLSGDATSAFLVAPNGTRTPLPARVPRAHYEVHATFPSGSRTHARIDATRGAVLDITCNSRAGLCRVAPGP